MSHAFPRARVVALAALACVGIALLLPDLSEARSCRSPARATGVTKLSARHVSCSVARRLARASSVTRRNPTRFAHARRCRGVSCIVVRGFRCRPLRGPAPRERCTRGRRSITWTWSFRR